MMMIIGTYPHSDDDVDTLYPVYSFYTVYYSNYFTPHSLRYCRNVDAMQRRSDFDVLLEF